MGELTFLWIKSTMTFTFLKSFLYLRVYDVRGVQKKGLSPVTQNLDSYAIMAARCSREARVLQAD